jgi:hypothetical protein
MTVRSSLPKLAVVTASLAFLAALAAILAQPAQAAP